MGGSQLISKVVVLKVVVVILKNYSICMKFKRIQNLLQHMNIAVASDEYLGKWMKVERGL